MRAIACWMMVVLAWANPVWAHSGHGATALHWHAWEYAVLAAMVIGAAALLTREFVCNRIRNGLRK